MANRQIGIILRQLQKLLERQPESDLSDAQLLRRFVRHHDEAAFELLVQRHGRLVWGVCRHVLHDDHDAEDAFQGSFLVLARKAGSIRNQNAVGSWLYGVAYRIARKARLAASRRRTHESRATPPVETNAQSDLAWRELQAALNKPR